MKPNKHDETANTGDVGDDITRVITALEAAEQFMASRDQMNAAVHLAPVRYSPATDLVRSGLDAAGRVRSALHPLRAPWRHPSSEGAAADEQ